MKRSGSKNRPKYITDDIERDLSPNQLAKIGAISFAYNNAEARIDELLGVVTGLDGEMLLQVSTRINGLDGKIAIITHGAKALSLSEDNQRLLEETLGQDVFQKLKKYRDAVIHARLISAPESIGQRVERRAQINEVLLTQDALDVLYLQLKALCAELHAAWAVLVIAGMLKRAGSDDPKRGLLESELGAEASRYQDCRSHRLSLPPIPEFPPESEYQLAVLEWSKAHVIEALEKMVRDGAFDRPEEQIQAIREAIGRIRLA